MLYLYQLLSILLSPLINLYLLTRKKNQKEDLNRFNERLGKSKINRPKGELILIHAASVGESKSALTLAKALLNSDDKLNILITSGTVTSAAEIAKNLPKRCIHQYAPIDRFFDVKRFTKHWQPNLAIFIESELWPNLITILQKSGSKLALINGKISDRSLKRWKILHLLGFNLLKNFSLIFAQSKIDQKKFKELGINNVHFAGNLKAANEMLKVDEKTLAHLKKEIGRKKFWLAASTHKGEEEIIIQTHLQLKKKFSNLLTIIAIRHPHRRDEVLKLIPKNLKVAIHSQKDSPKNCDIYLVDTLGELGTFYSLSKISLICGSLIPNIGGHNPYEALQLDSLILSGKYVKNFEEIYDDLAKAKICILVENAKDLEKKISKLLGDKNYYSSLMTNAQKIQHNNEKMLGNISQHLI